jgi:hypothetical protein
MTTFYCLRFETPQNLEGQVPVFISPRNRVAQLYPQALVPFSSPPTTRRATVEVFEPVSKRGLDTKSKLLYGWCVARLYSELYSEVALSRKPFGIGHTYIYTFLLRMTDTVTSQNIDVSSCDTLYKRRSCAVVRR